jgi:multicomponent Na+:H+ antiporter subunit D
MTEVLANPGVWLVLTGLVLPFLPEALRRAAILAVPLAALAWIWSLPDGVAGGAGGAFTWLGLEIVPVRVDALGRLFATIFAFMAFAGGLFALNQRNAVELAAAFVYSGSAIGVALAGDLLTVFAFWEIMAIGSTTVVWMGGAGASAAGLRYAVIHFLGGVLLMTGIAGHVAATGSTEFAAMGADGWTHWLILAAFLINAGAPPLSAWLPDAYPRASWSGTVFLSAFTTKVAVYALIRGFPGEEVLIWVGLYMAFYGIVYAILENDMRRILAYSICNGAGLMVCAVGIGTDLALNGAAAYAVVHIIYKALLLMSAGSVLYMTGRSLCTDLGGLFRTMPVSCLCGIVGALAISSFPLTSGFAAKSMITSGAGEEHLFWVWLALAAASAGVFLSVGIKFPWFVFFQKDSGLRTTDPPWNMQAAMILMSVASILLGIWYAPLYAMLPFATDYQPYSVHHVVFMLQLLLFSGLAFFLLLPWLQRTRTITLDTDWFWRGGGRALSRALGVGARRGWRTLAMTVSIASRLVGHELLRQHGPTGSLARTRPSGSMALWMTVLLTAFLVFAFF